MKTGYYSYGGRMEYIALIKHDNNGYLFINNTIDPFYLSRFQLVLFKDKWVFCGDKFPIKRKIKKMEI